MLSNSMLLQNCKWNISLHKRYLWKSRCDHNSKFLITNTCYENCLLGHDINIPGKIINETFIFESLGSHSTTDKGFIKICQTLAIK